MAAKKSRMPKKITNVKNGGKKIQNAENGGEQK